MTVTNEGDPPPLLVHEVQTKQQTNTMKEHLTKCILEVFTSDTCHLFGTAHHVFHSSCIF